MTLLVRPVVLWIPALSQLFFPPDCVRGPVQDSGLAEVPFPRGQVVGPPACPGHFELGRGAPGTKPEARAQVGPGKGEIVGRQGLLRLPPIVFSPKPGKQPQRTGSAHH